MSISINITYENISSSEKIAYYPRWVIEQSENWTVMDLCVDIVDSCHIDGNSFELEYNGEILEGGLNAYDLFSDGDTVIIRKL